MIFEDGEEYKGLNELTAEQAKDLLTLYAGAEEDLIRYTLDTKKDIFLYDCHHREIFLWEDAFYRFAELLNKEIFTSKTDKDGTVWKDFYIELFGQKYRIYCLERVEK